MKTPNNDRRSQYMEKLRDPRWQKKRLEVMQRDEFTCQICFDSESTLNIHHNYYKNNKDPWDYPLEALVTLCETCHEEETDTRRQEEQSLLEVLRLIGMKASHVNGLMSSLWQTFGEQSQFADRDDYALDAFILNFEHFQPIVNEWLAQRREERKARGL